MNKDPINAVIIFQGHTIVGDFWVCDVGNDAAPLVIEDLVQFIEEDEKE